MKHLPSMHLALALCCALAALPATAADAPAGASAPAQAPPAAAAEPSALERQLQRIRELRQQRPGDGVLVYYEAMTLAGMGQAEPAVAALEQLAGRRLGLVPPPAAGPTPKLFRAFHPV